MTRTTTSKLPYVDLSVPKAKQITPAPPNETASLESLQKECQALAKLCEQQAEQQRALAASIMKRSQRVGIDCPQQFIRILGAQPPDTTTEEEQASETPPAVTVALPQPADVAPLLKHIDEIIERRLQAMISSAVSTAVAHAMEAFTSPRRSEESAARGHVNRSSAMPAIKAAQAPSGQVSRPTTYAGAASQPPVTNLSPASTGSPRNRPNRVPVKTPLTDSELECFFTKKPLNGLARAILYFRGLGRRDIWQVRRLFATLEIPAQAVQFISFIGANVAEMIVLDSLKDEVVTRLASVNVTVDATFDPLSPRAFTNTATIERLGLAGKPEREQVEAAKRAFLSRLDSMQAGIAGHRLGLKSFLRSLRKAVAEGAPTGHFFNPALRPRPTLNFDITKTRAIIEAMRPVAALAASPEPLVPDITVDDVMLSSPIRSSRKRPNLDLTEQQMPALSPPVDLPSGEGVKL